MSEQHDNQQVATRPQGRMTVAQERALAKTALVQAVDGHRSDIERLLKPLGVPFDLFAAGVQIGLNQIAKTTPDFFEKVSVNTYLRECMQVARVGLVPDGKKAAIVAYGSDASAIIMVEGFVEVLKKSGIKDINHNVVIEGDEFDYEEGSNPFIKHKPSLTRDSNGKALAAWCIVHTVDGGYYQEITVASDLERIAKTNRAGGNGPRGTWAGEMHRKAPLRRLAKRLPKQPGSLLEMAIDIDDRNYTLAPIPATERPNGIPKGALFSDKRHQAAPAEEAQEAMVEEIAPQEKAPAKAKGKGKAKAKPAEEEAKPQEDEGGEDATRAGEMAHRLTGAETLVDLGQEWDLIQKAKPPLSAESMDWLKGVMDGQRQKLDAAEKADEAPIPQLQLLLSSKDGPRTFEDPAEWGEAFGQRLGQIKASAHENFWLANKAYVLAAAKDAPKEAGAIILAMGERGFNVEPEHDA